MDEYEYTLTIDNPKESQEKQSILSAEVFIIPTNNYFLVYTPLKNVAFVANSQLVNTLVDIKEGKITHADELEDKTKELFQHLQLINTEQETQPLRSYSGDPSPTAITLFLTTGCNLRCTYCYASAGETPLKSMPFAVAKRGIDYVVNNALEKNQTHISIAYHGGGEPTTNWNVLTKSFDYASQLAQTHNMQLSATSATNGVLNEHQIDWIIDHLDGVSLSFDGLPEVHDHHRVTTQGTGSSQNVIHSMNRFDQADFNYGVRVTVTHDHIQTLPQSIKFICQNFKPRKIQVEPAYQLGRWEGQPSAETEAFIASYREAQAHAYQHGYELYYSGARLGTLTNHFCGVSQDSFSLTPDGNVSACYEAFSEENPFADIFFYGQPEPDSEGYQFNLDALQKLRNQSVDHRSFCQGCFAKWNCAGDCYHKSLAVNGRGEFAGSDRCHITRELLKDQILTKIVQSGGLFWHEEQHL